MQTAVRVAFDAHMMNSSNICAYPGCTSPVWVDRTGTPSKACSRSHMTVLLPRRAQTQMLCKHCGLRPVYMESGRVHDFCGRTCANAYKPVVGGGLALRKRLFKANIPAGGGDMCLLCGRSPKTTMAGKLGDFCSIRCREDTYKAAPAILEVPSSQAEYRSVADQFKDQWKHSATPPGVVAVYKVYSHPTHVQSFLAYKKAVGNSRRRWHGTTRQCCIGDDSRNTGFCTKTGCSICSILQNSFQVAKARNGMFGVGVYTSATSSKSNGYIQNLGGSNYRAILLTEVIMGKVCKMTTNSSGLTQAPAGYDSVVGEPGTGLSHDEAIVYKNEAIRPLYLVIFQS